MARKYWTPMILGLLSGILVLPGILKWLGIPTFAQLLYRVLGPSNTINIALALLLLTILIFIVLKLPTPKKK
ncbi:MULTISPECIES: hypothetical protein [unclassified Lysinibacillus]|uniref:hypothetical protein n=1 Tax=unclassified Lysinibacillus TaxID=2636778 RepID=UPI0035D68248